MWTVAQQNIKLNFGLAIPNFVQVMKNGLLGTFVVKAVEEEQQQERGDALIQVIAPVVEVKQSHAGPGLVRLSNLENGEHVAEVVDRAFKRE